MKDYSNQAGRFVGTLISVMVLAVFVALTFKLIEWIVNL